MVARICLSYQHKLVDIYSGRNVSNINSTVNGKLPGNKSGDCEPGEEFENGVNANVKVGKCENENSNYLLVYHNITVIHKRNKDV